MKSALLVLLLTLSAAGAEYTIAPGSASYVRLEVDKTGLLKGKTHVFTFARYQGAVRYREDSLADSNLNFTMEAASIECTDTWLSAKDRSKVQQYAERDMLAVERYKDLSFRSVSIMAQGPNSLTVMGSLTIRDVTKPVEVSVRLRPGEKNSLTAEGTSLVKLTDFKLKPPSAALGTIGTKDEMRLSFTLQLVRSSR